MGTPDLLSPLGLAVSLFICLLVQFWGRLLDYLSDVCTPCSVKLLRTRPRHRHPDGGGVVGPAWLCLFLSPFTTLLPLGPRPVVAPLLRGCHSAVVRGAQGPDPDCPPLIRVSWAPCQRRFLRSALGGLFWPQAPSSASSRWCYLPPGKLVAPRWPILVCAASPPNVPGLEGAPGLSLLVGSFAERWVLCHHGRAVLWRRISTPELDRPAALSAGSHNCASSPRLAACLSDELELLSPTAPTERLS